MSNLSTRLAFANRVAVPDAWAEVVRRAEFEQPAPASRRRARSAIALATAVAFVAAVAWAGVALHGRRHVPPASTHSSWPVFGTAATQWTFRHPPGWTIETSGPDPVHRPQDQRLMAKVTRTVVTNAEVSLAGLDVGPNTPDTQKVMSRFGDGAVVVIIDRIWTDFGNPSSRVTEHAGSTQELPAGSGWRYTARTIERPDGAYTVAEWLGPHADAADIANANEVADSVHLDPIGRWFADTPTGLVMHDPDQGFTVTFPSGWYVADRNLTPHLSSPHEILSLGSYPLRPGGRAPTDAYLPGKAIADIGPNDVFLTIQASDTDASRFRARPTSFGPSFVCPGGSAACLAGQMFFPSLPLHAWWIPFKEGGNGYYAMVAMGNRAYENPNESQLPWEVLDSLTFQ